MLDSRPRGHRFEPHRCHCGVSLSKTHLSLLSTGSTQEDSSRITERLLSGRKESNQSNNKWLLIIACAFVMLNMVGTSYLAIWGAQWLRGRVLGSRLRGCGFEPHRHHCVVSLSKTHLSLLSTGSTLEDPSGHNLKFVDWLIKNQIKQTKINGYFGK